MKINIVMWSYAHVRSCVHQVLLLWSAGNVVTKYEGDHGVDCAANLSVHSHVIVYVWPMSAPLCSAIWLWRLHRVEDFGELYCKLIQIISLLSYFQLFNFNKNGVQTQSSSTTTFCCYMGVFPSLWEVLQACEDNLQEDGTCWELLQLPQGERLQSCIPL